MRRQRFAGAVLGAALLVSCRSLGAAAPAASIPSTPSPVAGEDGASSTSNSTVVESLVPGGSAESTPTAEVDPRERSDLFWDPLTHDGDFAYQFGSLSDIVRASDLIAVAKVADARQGPSNIIHEDQPDAAMTLRFVTARFAIDDLIKGDPEMRQPGQVEVTMFIPSREDVGQVLENVPEEPHLMFLLNEAADRARNGLPPTPGDPYRYWYLPINPLQGVIREFDGRAERLPDTSGDHSGLFDGIEGTDFDALVAQVRSIADRQE